MLCDGQVEVQGVGVVDGVERSLTVAARIGGGVARYQKKKAGWGCSPGRPFSFDRWLERQAQLELHDATAGIVRIRKILVSAGRLPEAAAVRAQSGGDAVAG